MRRKHSTLLLQLLVDKIGLALAVLQTHLGPRGSHLGCSITHSAFKQVSIGLSLLPSRAIPRLVASQEYSFAFVTITSCGRFTRAYLLPTATTEKSWPNTGHRVLAWLSHLLGCSWIQKCLFGLQEGLWLWLFGLQTLCKLLELKLKLVFVESKPCSTT